MTIFAQDVDVKIFVFRRHRRDENLIIKIIPKLLHVEHGLLASWARVVTRCEELLEAGSV